VFPPRQSRETQITTARKIFSQKSFWHCRIIFDHGWQRSADIGNGFSAAGPWLIG